MYEESIEGWGKHFDLFIMTLLLPLYLFVIKKGAEYSTGIICGMGMIYAVLTYTVRCVWKWLLQRKMRNVPKRSLLVITTSDTAEQALKDIGKDNIGTFCICGVVIADKDMTGKMIAGIRWYAVQSIRFIMYVKNG